MIPYLGLDYPAQGQYTRQLASEAEVRRGKYGVSDEVVKVRNRFVGEPEREGYVVYRVL